MKTYILATVGTSMLTNLRRELGLASNVRPEEQKTVALLRQREESDRFCGAESNSLAHLLKGQELSSGVVGPPAFVQLLVSDTEDGRWTGRVLTQYLRKMKGVEGVDFEVVTGLDGSKPQRFEREGLRSLVKLAAQFLRQAQQRYPEALRVIDATGGYKAQISFAGLIGQTLKVPVIYLFELFPHCIEMPPMPVNFDRSLWIEHYWLFDTLSAESFVPATRLQRRDIDTRLWNLLDRQDVEGQEYVALSPVLELMHQGFLLVPPAALTQPAASGCEPRCKIRQGKTQHHRPAGLDQRVAQLAQLPWVKRIEEVELENTAVSFRVRPGGVSSLDQILVVHGDGEMGVRLRLTTTCQNSHERDWCLEYLREHFGSA